MTGELRGGATDAVLDGLGRSGLIAVIRSTTKNDALRVSRVLLDAGVGALEITYTTPDACEIIAALRSEVGAGTLFGAGTIRSADEAVGAADAGADFLVSPGSPPGLVEAMLQTGLLVLPGVLTATELMQVRSLGVRTVKLFPACQIGTHGLRALRGPFPDMAFVPTGGIAADGVTAWFTAGAHAVGLGGSLAPPSLRTQDETKLASRVRRVLADTRTARAHGTQAIGNT